jgi:hypothetical protein
MKKTVLVVSASAILFGCSRVSVRQTGNHTYFLKCYYSREKCDAAIKKVCRDEDKISKVLSKREKMEKSMVFLGMGFLQGKRPVNYVTVECVDWKPNSVDTSTVPDLNNREQPVE